MHRRGFFAQAFAAVAAMFGFKAAVPAAPALFGEYRESRRASGPILGKLWVRNTFHRSESFGWDIAWQAVNEKLASLKRPGWRTKLINVRWSNEGDIEIHVDFQLEKIPV
jgi:hypothetical protein